MKTLVLANQKGGVGKTALVVNLAWDLLRHGFKVAVIDMDVQGNCSFSLSNYDTGIKTIDILTNSPIAPTMAALGISLFSGTNQLITIESMEVAVVATNLRTGLQLLASAGYDVCLLDSPAAFGVRFMTGLLAADFVLAPIELEAYSIQGIKQLVTTITNAKKANPQLRFLGMLANKVDGRNPRHGKHLAQLRESYPSLLLPMTIGLRSSIAESLVTGEPVWTNRKTAARLAAREIQETTHYIAEKMGMPVGLPKESRAHAL